MLIHKFLVRRKNANLWGGLFGGKLMKEFDTAGYFKAREFLQGVDYEYTTTACFKEINFLKPASPGDIVLIYGEVIETGKTSITIKITAIKEDIHHNKEEMANAIGIYVCMKNEKPFQHNKTL